VKQPANTRMLWWWTALLAIIGVAAVVHRMLLLVGPAPVVSALQGPPAAAALNDGFARHRLLTLSHIVPGLLFVVLAPLQFVRSLRARRPAVHRWIGRIVLACGIVIGSTALVMSPRMAIGGPLETAATTFFAILFLFALGRAFVAIRGGQAALHREWMIRAFAVGLAVAFVRPIVGIFFATSRLTHLTPHGFFGVAFWLGFTIQTIAAEVWIRYTRAQGLPAAPEARLRGAASLLR
jgi:uncharacterized membrane protein